MGKRQSSKALMQGESAVRWGEEVVDLWVKLQSALSSVMELESQPWQQVILSPSVMSKTLAVLKVPGAALQSHLKPNKAETKTWS